MAQFAKIPFTVRMILTKQCNLSCSFCLMDADKVAHKEELSTEEWLVFFERLKELRVFNVMLNGGEIFLRKDLFTLLRKLRDNRMHKITLFTNGTLLDDERIKELCSLNIKNIAISLDGMEESHDSLRGKGAFRKTLEGVQRLVRSGITPQISFTPVKSNYKYLDPLIDLMASEKIKAFMVNTLSPEGRCINIYEDIAVEFPNQVKEILDIVDAKRNKFPDMKIECQMGFYYHLPKSYQYYLENPQNYSMKHLKDGCGAACQSCTISSTGDVMPCEGTPMFSGGNIREQDLLNIWTNSENLKKIRNLSNVAMDESPYCKDCKYIYLCDGGCRASAYLVYNDLLAPGISCPFWKRDKSVTDTGVPACIRRIENE